MQYLNIAVVVPVGVVQLNIPDKLEWYQLNAIP
jgi:hypothetical protein